MTALDKSILKCNNLTARLFDSIRGRKSVVTIQALLRKGADVDARDSKGYTPLLLACKHRRIKIVELLIQSAANVDLKYSSNGYTALHYAAGNGWLNIVVTLVNKVSDLNIKCHVLGQTALHMASGEGYLEIVMCLLEKGVDINATDKDGETALHVASQHGTIEIVKCLVDNGADINYRGKNGETALHDASFCGQPEIVKYFVQKGVDIDVEDFNCASPMLHAAQSSHKDVVDLLMNSGASVDVPDAKKRTLLHYASINGWIDIIQSLVKQNCDLDASDEFGQTALSYSCMSDKWDIAQYLLQSGACWDIVNKIDGDSILSYIIDVEPEFLKLFIENGAYFKRDDYEALLESSCLYVLRDAKFCCQAIINKFNNCDLRELYKLPLSESLPHIEKMKIASGSEVAQAIKKTVEFEIQKKGYCNILEVHPMVLGAFSVGSFLNYCVKKKSVLKSWLKRPAACDPRNDGQSLNKVMRLK